MRSPNGAASPPSVPDILSSGGLEKRAPAPPRRRERRHLRFSPVRRAWSQGFRQRFPCWGRKTSKERKTASLESPAKDGRFCHAVQQYRGLSFGTRLPELWSSWKDYTTPGILNMDVENQLLGPPPNGSASEQEKEPVHFKAIKRRLLSVCCRHKKAIIGIVISLLIFGFAFILGTLVPLNCQKEAIKCQPDWIALQGHCYNFSNEEKNWKESQNFCMSHTASLAKITEEEMGFVRRLARNHVFWISLKREPDQPWKWLDGENSTLKVLGNGGDCAFLYDDPNASSGRCATKHHYICKKN